MPGNQFLRCARHQGQVDVQLSYDGWGHSRRTLEFLELAEKRAPESEAAKRPELVADLQQEVVAMLRILGLAQVEGRRSRSVNRHH